MDRVPPDPWWPEPEATPGRAWLECLGSAVAAPSLLNTQPWRFHVDEHGVDVLADRSRAVESVDPRGRELAISVGAALFNLRVAVHAHGRQPIVTLLPRPGEPDLLARVDLGPAIRPDETVRALAQAIPERHTNRQPFDDTPVPSEVISSLARAAGAEGAGLSIADEIGRMLVLSVVRRAEVRFRADPRYRETLGRWTGRRTDSMDGVPPETFGPWSAPEELPLRDFGLARPDETRARGQFEREPTIMVLYTVDDTARQWVRAGQALQRVLLTATAQGLSSTPMTQPLELPELRERLADPRNGLIVAQVVLRIGYGPPAQAAPRRRLEDVLVA